MKILLIASNISCSPYPVYLLGLSVVAAALKAAGHEIRQFDFLASEKSLAAVRRSVEEFAPEAIGVSIRNIDNVNLLNEQRYLEAVKEIVGVVKSTSRAPVILGGTGFSIMPLEVLQKTGADYGIVGEGEASMVEFLKHLKRGSFPSERIIHSGHKLTGSEISSAAYDPRIMQFYLQSGSMAPVQTKRGCRHRCIYCSYPVLEGHHIRPRDTHDIQRDIYHLVHEYKARYIFFTDSVFNDDDGYYLEVVEEMKTRGINVSWTAFFKPDLNLNDEVVALMRDTGLKAAEIGADASSDTTLRGIGKNFTFKEVAACNETFIRNGVATAHYYMFGGPGETEATVCEGIENIKSLRRTVSFIFMGIRIQPDTPLYDLALRERVITKEASLLEPVYYISPGIDKAWLEATLTEAFKNLRHCIFPPDKLDTSIQFLHKRGYAGSLWEMLLAGHKRERR